MVLRIILAALLAALLTGAGAWVVTAAQLADRPTEPEVKELIQAHSPYVADRKHLTEQVERVRDLERKLHNVQQDVTEVKTLLLALSKQLDKIETKLDNQ